MAEYFIAFNDQQHGPFPAHELPSRGLRHESLVWTDGMGDWQRADTIAELIPLLPGRQPPPPPVGWPAPAQPPFAPYAAAYPVPVYNPTNNNRVAAGVCGILLGGLGVHKFILGRVGAGMIMLLVSVLTCGIAWGVMHLIGLIEGIVYLCKSDEEFHQAYVVEQRSWF